MLLKFDVDILTDLVFLLIGYFFGLRSGRKGDSPWVTPVIWVVLLLALALLYANKII